MEKENFLLKLKEVVRDKKENSIDYDDMARILLGEENNWSSDNWRKFFYIAQPLLEKIDDSMVSSDDLVMEIEAAKEELFKERVRYQDKKREYNNKLRAEARFERLVEVLEENIQPIDVKPVVNVDSNRTATLLISDTHIGMSVDNQVNFFNKEVAQERLAELFGKTITYCEMNNVRRINVCLNGDLVNGIINITGRVEQEEDIITQIISASEMLSSVISNFVDKFDVTIYATVGNHSRVFTDKKQGLGRENFERMMFEYIKIKLPMVKFIDSKCADYLTFKVNDKLVVLSHGDRDSINNCTNHFTGLLGVKPDYVLLGHVHHHQVKNDNNTKIIVNGSLIGADEYAVSLRLATKPSQTLIIHGIDDVIIEVSLK